MAQVAEDLGFFVDLVNLVCLLEEVTDVYSLYGDDILGFLMHRPVYFAEAPFAKQLVNLVLVNDLRHVKWSALPLQIKLIAILYKIYIFVANEEPCQVVESNVPVVVESELFADYLQQDRQLLHVVDRDVARFKS